MGCRLSVIIPNRNGEKTIDLCLEALFRSVHDSFEIIVVDDCSTDNSVAIIEKFPCKLVALEQHVGAAAARNIGAENCSGALLFFTDADCLVGNDTLQRVEKLAVSWGLDTIIGGTYTCHPYDKTFYSTFQSVFIHFFELKNIRGPDYIASHAMVIASLAFQRSGGFPTDFLPMIEDVEFSHRLRDKGYRLVMEPDLQVQHIFGYSSMYDSMHNGYEKSKYWVMYSLGNKDVLADSGTASFELKMNVLVLFAVLPLIGVCLVSPSGMLLFFIAGLILVNFVMNQRLFSLFKRTGGMRFFIVASLYYMFIYPFAVGAGALAGLLNFLFGLQSVVKKRI